MAVLSGVLNIIDDIIVAWNGSPIALSSHITESHTTRYYIFSALTACGIGCVAGPCKIFCGYPDNMCNPNECCSINFECGVGEDCKKDLLIRQSVVTLDQVHWLFFSSFILSPLFKTVELPPNQTTLPPNQFHAQTMISVKEKTNVARGLVSV